MPFGNLPPELKASRFQFGLDIPVPKECNLEETQSECTKYAVLVFKGYTRLRMIVKRFDRIIEKRWLKKSLDQRRKILLQAWLSMLASHRPDLGAVRTPGKTRQTTRPRVSAHLWPYVVQEDLLQGPLLPLYIRSRGQNFPDLFFAHEVEEASLAHSG